ncbi:MAG TPA: hypothetical protein VLC46_21560 [Thermoanaerobaculia bacterium]|jgi:hypothetical protein|nr:hypothetical protein [Thermoanaerobaculia bacterium]
MTELLILNVICAIIGAMILSPYNKEGLGAVAGVVLGPVGVIAALVEKGRLRRIEENQHHAEQMRVLVAQQRPESDADDDRRACPYCAESVKRAARVCRFCSRDIPESPWAE